MESRFFSVLLNNLVVVFNRGFKVVSSVGQRVSLGGQISQFMGPSGSFSVFPSGISGSGVSDLSFKSVDQTGDLSEKFGVVGAGSDLSEGVDQRSVSGEFVVQVGHVLESLSDGFDSTLQLDEKSTSSHGSEKVNGILASVDTTFVFSIKSGPSGVFEISLSLTGFNSGVD